ncbi:hypothetical protein TIFTF001_049808 [Ficus carica]|uniref:Putative plant transposon protein domain-containing protein n=1 Tax=Ficus carica TaxID=3494 RepID=A0AA88CUY5_FICCA|nr:hypothetical protein TIFTF001_049808 [Ficus carica]
MPSTKKLAHKQTGRKPKDTTISYRTFQTKAVHDRQFYAHPADAVVPVVREFYAHLAGEGHHSVYVRGVQVPIDDDTINQFYGLDDVEDLHTEYAANASADWLDCALENVCVPGTTWTVSTQGKLTVPKANLTPQCKGRILLLDSIISGRPIDVGKIIFQEHGACPTKKCGSLWFPSLITSLCANNGVPMFDTEERLLFSKGAITKAAIARLLHVKMAKGPSQPPHNQEDEAGQAPQAPMNSTAASSSRDPTQADLTNSLQKLEKRMSLADKNFTKPIFPFPEFPDNVLEQVAAEEVVDAVDEEDEDDKDD